MNANGQVIIQIVIANVPKKFSNTSWSSLESGSQPVGNDILGGQHISYLHYNSQQQQNYTYEVAKERIDGWGQHTVRNCMKSRSSRKSENHCSQSSSHPLLTCYPGTYQRHNFFVRQYLIHSYLSQFKTWLGFSTYLVSNTRIQSKRCSGLFTLFQNGSYEEKKICMYTQTQFVL